jgi:hypothetical protein
VTHKKERREKMNVKWLRKFNECTFVWI